MLFRVQHLKFFESELLESSWHCRLLRKNTYCTDSSKANLYSIRLTLYWRVLFDQQSFLQQLTIFISPVQRIFFAHRNLFFHWLNYFIFVLFSSLLTTCIKKQIICISTQKNTKTLTISTQEHHDIFASELGWRHMRVRPSGYSRNSSV